MRNTAFGDDRITAPTMISVASGPPPTSSRPLPKEAKSTAVSAWIERVETPPRGCCDGDPVTILRGRNGSGQHCSTRSSSVWSERACAASGSLAWWIGWTLIPRIERALVAHPSCISHAVLKRTIGALHHPAERERRAPTRAADDRLRGCDDRVHRKHSKHRKRQPDLTSFTHDHP